MSQVSDKRFEELFRNKKPINFGVVAEEPFRDIYGDNRLKIVYELWCADVSGKTTLKIMYRYPVSEKGIALLKRLFALYEMDNSYLDTLNEQIERAIQMGDVLPYRPDFAFETEMRLS